METAQEEVREVRINGHPEYSIDTNGIVRSYKRGGMTVLTSRDNKRGYIISHLWDNGKKYSPKIHRLVAIHFIPNPDNKEEVNHIDGDKNNNKLSNLEWVSRLENMHHHYHILGNTNPSGKDHYKSIPVIQYNKDGSEIASFDSYSQASQETGIPHANIWKVANGLRKSAGGFKWKYKEAEGV